MCVYEMAVGPGDMQSDPQPMIAAILYRTRTGEALKIMAGKAGYQSLMQGFAYRVLRVGWGGLSCWAAG